MLSGTKEKVTGMAAADCVVLEDAPAGIEAGRAAGMRVIALTTTHPLEELSADAYAESLAAIQVRRLSNNCLELLVEEYRG
jgi:sugar-phosphatase